MFEPENELEQLLFSAVSDFNARAKFYNAFLDHEIFFVTDLGEPPADALVEIPLGEDLSVVPTELNGTSQLAVYTAPSRILTALRASGFEFHMNYQRIKARQFFEITIGNDVVLNPASECNKIFYKQEIRKLLDGTHADQKGLTIVLEKQATVKAPTNDVKDVVNALSSLCQKQEKVKTAYLALVQDPKANAPRTVIGTEVDEGFEEIKPHFDKILTQTRVPNPPFEVIEITPANAIGQLVKANGISVYKRQLKKKKFLGLF